MHLGGASVRHTLTTSFITAAAVAGAAGVAGAEFCDTPNIVVHDMILCVCLYMSKKHSNATRVTMALNFLVPWHLLLIAILFNKYYMLSKLPANFDVVTVCSCAKTNKKA